MKLTQLCAMAGLSLALLLAPGARATPFTFTFSSLPSGGQISGQPGQLIGWGYDVLNTDAGNWFVPTQLSVSSFALGAPDAGYFDFPIVAPGASHSANFDAASTSGLYGLQLFNFVLPGQSESGMFTLSGEWWSGDPLAGGSFLQTSAAVQSPFTVLVVSATTVPSPGTLSLLGGGLLLFWLGQRRRQKPEQFGIGLGGRRRRLDIQVKAGAGASQ
ncbi:hypothetical protein AAKU55_000922 [Oxalobacteraceae bacterium GrIS 1.11]